MKKIRFSALIVFTLIIASISACKKDETDKIVGSWKKVSVEEKKSGGSWKIITKDCHTDDLEEYTSSGKWTLYDGTDQCNPGSGITTGTWRLAAENTKVIYTYSGFSGDYESTIETLDEKNMVLTFATGDVDNTQMKVTYSKK